MKHERKLGDDPGNEQQQQEQQTQTIRFEDCLIVDDHRCQHYKSRKISSMFE